MLAGGSKESAGVSEATQYEEWGNVGGERRCHNSARGWLQLHCTDSERSQGMEEHSELSSLAAQHWVMTGGWQREGERGDNTFYFLLDSNSSQVRGREERDPRHFKHSYHASSNRHRSWGPANLVYFLAFYKCPWVQFWKYFQLKSLVGKEAASNVRFYICQVFVLRSTFSCVFFWWWIYISVWAVRYI